MNKLKAKYDKIFDDIFFSKEFKDSVVEKFGYCPNGLTFDTIVEDDNPEFICRCKQYGYDYSGERVIGDYKITKPTVDLEKYGEYMGDYIIDNYPELYEEISKYDIYCD